MKKKLIGWAFLFAMGLFSPDAGKWVKEWYTAPPSPPSPGTRLLVDSLQGCYSGWYTTYREGSKLPVIKRGKVVVDPGYFYASVYVNDSKVDGQFSYSDLKLINAAASYCIRELTAKAMNSSVGEQRLDRADR